MGYNNPVDAIEGFEKMMKEMDLHQPIAGDRETELDILSKSVNPVRLKNNPIQIDEKTAKVLYNSILA